MPAALRGRSFRPRWWAVAATLVFVAITVRLGNWQGDRAEYKLGQQAQLDSAMSAPAISPGAALRSPDIGTALRYRLLEVEGEFDAQALLFADNRIHDGKAGYQVLQRMQIRLPDGGSADLIVDRGWVVSAADRSLPKLDTPAGSVRIKGRINLPPSRNPGTFDNDGGVRLNYIDLGEIGRSLRRELLPFLLEQESGPGFTGVAKAAPSGNFEKNRAYQVQWYSFAALAVVFFVILSFRKRDAV